MDTNESSITSFNKITEGVIWKEMIKYCIPIAVGTLFQQLYNVVDAIVVGRAIGTEALAAVGGSASILSMVIIAFFSGLTAGASVIIAQHYGAKAGKKVGEAMHTAFAFAISCGLIMGIAGCLSTEWLLEMMKTPEDTMDLSVSYLRIYFVGLVATLTFNMGASVMRSIGDSKRPLYYLIVCSILNIVLDIVFVVFFGWGIIGAAVATVAAQVVSCIMTLYSLMHSYDEVKLEFRKIRIIPHVLWRELRIGIPGGFQSCISGITNIMIQTAINSFGANVTAGWAAYNKLDMIYWMVLSSFGAAATTFVGQNYGANRMDRVKKTARTSFMLSTVTCSIILVVLVALAEPLMSIFTTNPDVVKTGAEMLYFLVPMYFLAIIMEIPTDVLRGLGYTFWPMTFALITMVGLRIPWLLFVVPVHHTVNNVLLSYPIAIGSAAILINAYFFIVMRRLRKKS